MFKTFDDYRKAWGAAYTSDPAVPLNIDIELASLCNLACPFCFWGETDFNQEMQKHADDGKPKKRLMPRLLALKIIDEAAAMGVPALKFNWRGESTMHPDYSEILGHAARLRGHENPDLGLHELVGGNCGCPKAFHEILVNTNANCKDHAIDGLMAATKVMISLDSVVPETYAKMRVNGNLLRAIQVGNTLIRRGHPNLWFRRVITKANQGEPFKARVDEIFGGTGYQVSEHYCVDRSDDSKHESTANPAAYERQYCGYPSQRMMIGSDGTVYPCCADYDGTMPMGKYTGEGDGTLAMLWENAKFKSLRSELRCGTFKSAACANCTSWMAYKAPQRDHVQDVAIK